MEGLKRAALQFKDRITKTPLEREILEATNNDNWGVSTANLQQIAEKTFNHGESEIIMRFIWKNLKVDGKEWRKMYKTLNLVEHILKFGSSRAVEEIRDNTFKIRTLQDFSYRDEGVERGTGSKL